MSDTPACPKCSTQMLAYGGAARTSVMTAGAAGTTAGLSSSRGAADFYCPKCLDECEHLNALLFGEGVHFCGCGDPEEAYNLVRAILEACPLYQNWESGRSNGQMIQEVLGGHDGVFYLILYTLTHADLLEHGGNVGGSWLTEKGTYYLSLMRRHEWVDVEEAGLPHNGEGCPATCPHWIASHAEWRREQILRARAEKAPDPREPVPGADPRCRCSREPHRGWNVVKVSGEVALPHDAGAALSAGSGTLWLHTDCPHHGGLARALTKGA